MEPLWNLGGTRSLWAGLNPGRGVAALHARNAAENSVWSLKMVCPAGALRTLFFGRQGWRDGKFFCELTGLRNAPGRISAICQDLCQIFRVCRYLAYWG